MTVAEEIMNLKNRLAFNQKLFGQCMVKNDTATMQFLEQRNRELIDHLNRLEDTGQFMSWNAKDGDAPAC